MNNYELTDGQVVQANSRREALTKAGYTDIHESKSYNGRVIEYAKDKQGKTILAFHKHDLRTI